MPDENDKSWWHIDPEKVKLTKKSPEEMRELVRKIAEQCESNKPLSVNDIVFMECPHCQRMFFALTHPAQELLQEKEKDA